MILGRIGLVCGIRKMYNIPASRLPLLFRVEKEVKGELTDVF